MLFYPFFFLWVNFYFVPTLILIALFFRTFLFGTSGDVQKNYGKELSEMSLVEMKNYWQENKQ